MSIIARRRVFVYKRSVPLSLLSLTLFVNGNRYSEAERKERIEWEKKYFVDVNLGEEEEEDEGVVIPIVEPEEEDEEEIVDEDGNVVSLPVVSRAKYHKGEVRLGCNMIVRRIDGLSESDMFWMCEDESKMTPARKKMYAKMKLTENPDIALNVDDCPGRVGGTEVGEGTAFC